jgi:hypothetical protein
MIRTTVCFSFILLLGSFVNAAAQDPLIAKVQQRLEDQHARQAKASYSYISQTLVHALDKAGNVEKVDTIRNWKRFVSDSLVTDSLIYSSEANRREKEGKKGKKEGKHSESVGMPKLTDPSVECSVAPGDNGLATITFKPKKPKGGDIAGELIVDTATGGMRKTRLWMPKTKWPVKEFAMKMDWAEAGGLLVPSYLWMQAGWNAIISSGRIRIETTISDIKVE